MRYAGAAVVEKLQAGWRLVMGRGTAVFVLLRVSMVVKKSRKREFTLFHNIRSSDETRGCPQRREALPKKKIKPTFATEDVFFWNVHSFSFFL